MIELTTTRANELVDPLLHVWGWEIPVYLFLGGWVAGIMILSGWFLLTDRSRSVRCSCYLMPSVAIGLLSLGMGALFLDLEHKLYVWRLYTTFEATSPMSWGSWILLLVYPALVFTVLLRVPAPVAERFPALDRLSERLLSRPRWLWVAGGANIALGILLGIYTGILLSALGARPLWNSSVLGPLFLASGLSTAAAFGHMVSREVEEREILARVDNFLLGGELALFGLLLVGLATSGEVAQAAARLVLGGPYTAVFWVLVIGLGIVLPLVVQSLAVRHVIRHTVVVPLLVMAGGVALRFVIVAAGQASQWPVL